MRGCSKLGLMYENGRGVTKRHTEDVRYTEAVRLYRQACEGGEMRGCYNLGIMYENGRGVTKSNTEARQYYQEACDGGDDYACRYAH